jgi:hypothetical protein
MCKDSSINYLSEIGFSAISLPRDGIKPLTLLRVNEDDKLEILGSVTNLIEPCTPRLTPEVMTDCKVKDPKLEDLVTDNFSFEFGTNLINSILKRLGLQFNILPEIGFSYDRVQKVKFSFDNILCDLASPGQIARYCRTAQIVDLPHFVNDLVIRSGTKPIEHAIVVKILKSNNFKVWAYDKEDVAVDLTVPVIKGVTVGLDIDVSSEYTNCVSFKGSTHLAFAVQLAPVWIDEGPEPDWPTHGFRVVKCDRSRVNDGFTGRIFDVPQNDIGVHPVFEKDGELDQRDITNPPALLRPNNGEPILIVGDVG